MIWWKPKCRQTQWFEGETQKTDLLNNERKRLMWQQRTNKNNKETYETEQGLEYDY